MSLSKIMNLEEDQAAAAGAPAMKQGIVAILGSDNRENHTYKSSIRRTLSADMSSKKWLEQNGFFSPMKKIVSSEVLVRMDRIPGDSSSVSSSTSSSLSESDEENDDQKNIVDENPCQDDVWRSIQAEKYERNNGSTTASKMNSWGSLLMTQKSESSISLIPVAASPPLPPYVHPGVKRSASLSDKSLKICTESLGSETGSDCFSSFAAEFNDSDNEDSKLKEVDSFSNLHVPKYKASPARPFPPPLPSIAGGGDGVSLHMHSRRENGRLVLEAVSVPAKNHFQANRRDGRLVLTMIRTPAVVAEENKIEEFDGQVFDDIEEVGGDVVEEEMVDDGGEDGDGGNEVDAAEEVVAEKDLRSINPMSVQKPGLVMKKLVAIGNKNPATWSNKFNESVAAVDEEVEEEELVIPKSLPPLQRTARLIPSPAPPLGAASFNPYEYFWRNKSAVCGGGGFVNPIIATTTQAANIKHSYNNVNVINGGSKAYENHELMPYLKGCKEPRRSLFWEPYCIATS